MYYKPVGTTIQLMDGRVLKKNQQNLWEDINTGVAISEQILIFMMTHPSFSADASSGGSSHSSQTPVGSETSLSEPFNDIVITEIFVDTFNTNRTITTTGGPLSLRLSFSGTLNSGTMRAYKNDVDIGNLRVSGSTTTWLIPGTFDDGDQLKFSMFTPSLGSINFDVTIENLTTPIQTLDIFNISN